MVRPCWAILSLGTITLGCSEIGAPLTPAAIEVVLGDGQAGAVGQSLDLPLAVRVTDRRGDGYPGATVDFAVTSGGGVLNDEWEACSGPQEWGGPAPTVSAGTLSGGYAWVRMTPTVFGTTTVQARVGPLPPVTFTVDVDDPQVTVEITEPYEEEVIAGTSIWIGGPQFEILVEDDLGDPVPGAQVRWEVTSGGGHLSHLHPGCFSEEPAPGVLITRSAIGRDGGPVGSGRVQFRPTAFGISTITASVTGTQSPPATFTVDATVLLILLAGSTFYGPDAASDVDVPVGATVEWLAQASSARIVSSSTPPGGTPFDSGDLTSLESFQFVPDVAGTWSFVDQVSGAEGTLTAS